MGGIKSSSPKAPASGGGSSSFGKAGSAAGAGMTIYSALKGFGQNKSDTSEYNRQIKTLYAQQMQEQQRKQNILEEQLASRRARLGAMGITSTGSAEVSQGKMIDNVYQDISEDNEDYNNQYSQLNKEYNTKVRQRLLENVLGTTSKVIK